MKYLKVVLTVIAILLTLHLVKEYIPLAAQAGDVMQVDIVRVGGRNIFSGAVPVEQK